MNPESQFEARRFGRFSVTRVLGEGAMGTVYAAHDEMLAREVAIKTVRPAASGSLRDELFRQRFLHEARAVAALSHANIVRVFEMGFEGEQPYLVMELVPGRALDARLRADGALSISEARTLGIQIARALGAAHERGVTHRDVKPANILEADDGTWKLSDFGVAHVPSSSLTLDGQFVGTPSYAAPEALAEGTFGPATDVYGLGATIFDALVGEPPFGRGPLAAVVTTDEAPRVAARRADCPADLDACVAAALARNPSSRPSIDELARLLAGGGPALTTPPIALDPAAVQAPLAVAVAAVSPPSHAHHGHAHAHVAGAGRRNGPLWLTAGALLGLGLYCSVAGSGSAPDRSAPRPLPSALPASLSGPASPADLDEGPSADELEALWAQANERLMNGDLEGGAELVERLYELDPTAPEVQRLHDHVHDLLDAAEGRGKKKGKRKPKHER